MELVIANVMINGFLIFIEALIFNRRRFSESRFEVLEKATCLLLAGGSVLSIIASIAYALVSAVFAWGLL